LITVTGIKRQIVARASGIGDKTASWHCVCIAGNTEGEKGEKQLVHSLILLGRSILSLVKRNIKHVYHVVHQVEYNQLHSDSARAKYHDIRDLSADLTRPDTQDCVIVSRLAIVLAETWKST
jgi:hypothetical protein